MADIDVSGKHSREELAEHLEKLAKDLRRNESVLLTVTDPDGQNDQVELDPPNSINFAMDVNRNTSWLGNSEDTTLDMQMSWSEEEKTDEERLDVG